MGCAPTRISVLFSVFPRPFFGVLLSPFLGVLLWLAACGSTPTSASDAGPLRLTVAPAPTVAPSKDSAPFVIRLENVSADPITLTFPSSCQVMPYIAERRTERIVHPEGGAYGCATVVTSLTLGPGESHTETVLVTTAAAAPPAIRVPAGDYVIYAKLEDAKYRLRSASYPFTLE